MRKLHCLGHLFGRALLPALGAHLLGATTIAAEFQHRKGLEGLGVALVMMMANGGTASGNGNGNADDGDGQAMVLSKHDGMSV